jgi:tetratricopeptide (TPR) repeat protein
MADRLDQLQKLHAADPNDPFCTYAIAMEHAKAGRDREALDWLDKTLTSDPRYCYAYYHKAKLLSRLGDAASARTVLATGLRTAQEAKDAKAQAEMSALLQTLGV